MPSFDNSWHVRFDNWRVSFIHFKSELRKSNLQISNPIWHGPQLILASWRYNNANQTIFQRKWYTFAQDFGENRIIEGWYWAVLRAKSHFRLRCQIEIAKTKIDNAPIVSEIRLQKMLKINAQSNLGNEFRISNTELQFRREHYIACSLE